MLDAEEDFRSTIANAVIRLGENSESEIECLSVALDVLAEQLDRLQERWEEAGYEWPCTDDLDIDDSAEEDFDDYYTAEDDEYSGQDYECSDYGSCCQDLGDDDFEDY